MRMGNAVRGDGCVDNVFVAVCEVDHVALKVKKLSDHALLRCARQALLRQLGQFPTDFVEATKGVCMHHHGHHFVGEADIGGSGAVGDLLVGGSHQEPADVADAIHLAQDNVKWVCRVS